MTLMSRRFLRGAAAVAAAVFVGALGAARPAATGQTPAPAAPAQAPPDLLTFNVDRMLVVFQVAEAGGTDFEVTMGKVKEVLSKSEKAERKQQAAHWKLLKITAPQNGMLTYFFLLEEVAKGVSYDPFKILAEGLPPDEVRALYEKIGLSLKGVNAAPMGPILNMGGGLP